MTVKTRRRLIRAGGIALYLAAVIGLFIGYRGHMLLIDNKSTDGELAIDLMEVSLDNGPAVEFLAGDRDRFTVAGARHQIVVRFFDGRPNFQAEIKLPLAEDMFLLSIPKLIAGKLPAVEPFVQVRDSSVSREEESTESIDFFGPTTGL